MIWTNRLRLDTVFVTNFTDQYVCWEKLPFFTQVLVVPLTILIVCVLLPPFLFVSGNLVSSLLVARISLSRYSPMSCQNISTGMIEPSMIFVKKSRYQGFLIFTQKIMLKKRNKWFWTQHQMTCQDVPKNVYVQTHELPKNWVQNGLDRPLKSHLPEKFGQWRLFRPCPWLLFEQNCAEYCPKVLVIM